MGKTDQAISIERYKIIPRVLIFLFNKENEVLLLKGSSTKKIWPNLWNGLGGHVEPGESTLTAAKREVFEESGLLCEKLIFCGQVIVSLGTDFGIGINIFKAGKFKGYLQSSNEGELGWFSMETALRLPLVEDLYTLLPKVFVFNKGDDPLFGTYSYDSEDRLVIRFE